MTGIELALVGQFGQVAAEAIEGRGLRFAFARSAFAAAAAATAAAAASAAAFSRIHIVTKQVQYLLAHVLELEAQVHQDLCCHAFLLSQQAQEQVLGSDIVVIEIPRFFHRVFENLLGPWRLGQFPHGHHVRARLNQLLDLKSDLAQIDVQVLENVGSDAGSLLHQAEQDVLGADVFVIEPLRFLIGELHHLAGSVRETFIHSAFSVKN